MTPSDPCPDAGPGGIDYFEYLRYSLSRIYKYLPLKNYEERYFVFHKKDPWRKELE